MHWWVAGLGILAAAATLLWLELERRKLRKLEKEIIKNGRLDHSSKTKGQEGL
jgi:divalent metal cation (Fe/Co/Zn/Cd) transporter